MVAPLLAVGWLASRVGSRKHQALGGLVMRPRFPTRDSKHLSNRLLEGVVERRMIFACIIFAALTNATKGRIHQTSPPGRQKREGGNRQEGDAPNPDSA